jgi:hypothetical protein
MVWFLLILWFLAAAVAAPLTGKAIAGATPEGSEDPTRGRVLTMGRRSLHGRRLMHASKRAARSPS